MVVVLWAVVTGKVVLVGNDRITSLMIYLFFTACIAIASSYLFFDTPYDHRDFMILPMIVQYWLVYCFAKSVRDPKLMLYSVKMVSLFVALSALIGMCQKFNIFGVNDWLSPLYVEREYELWKLREESYYGRSVGTIGDPRHFAFLLGIGIAAATALIFLIKKNRPKWYFSALLFCMAALPLSASRTGFAAAILVVFIGLYLLNKISSRRFNKYLLIGGMVFPTLFIFYLDVVPQGSTDRLFQTDTDSFQSSLAGRQRDNLEPYVRALNEPLILITGRGPAKSIFPGSEHSDLGWMTLHFGLFGLACYLGILYRSYQTGIKRYQRRGTSLEEHVFAMFSLMLLGNWAFFALAESIFKLNQLMSINMFTLGVLGAQSFAYRRIKYNQPKHKEPVLHNPQNGMYQ